MGVSLESADYWQSDGIDIRLNPKGKFEAGGLAEFLTNRYGIEAAVVLATSGSTGRPKFAILKKSALLASAEAVNRHCGLTGDDRWLGGLSTFHVGGLGIYARAFLNGAAVIPMAWDEWSRDGSSFLEAIGKARATVTSLTPIHLHDLVAHDCKCPESLRCLFLGGGHIEADLFAKAVGLGWPLRATYGMTEASSQIATSLDGDHDWLSILPHWECRIGDGGRLEIRGEALFSGYAERDDEGWSFSPVAGGDGWFTTGDRVDLSEGRLRFAGRADDRVKVLGELVSLTALSERLQAVAGGGIVVAVPSAREENELVAVVEGEGCDRSLLNRGLPPYERISRFVMVTELPRTLIGKVDHEAVMRLIEES